MTRYLPSSSGPGVLRDSLYQFISLVVTNRVDLNSAVPLIKQVVEHASVRDILNTVIALVAPQVIPPTAFNKFLHDTPLKSTSSSQQGSEQTHDEIDPRILQEINGCIYKDTKGFYEKYFEGKSWLPAVEEIILSVNPRVVDGRWAEYPSPPSQEAFLGWFWTFQARFLQGRSGTYHTSHSAPLDGSDAKRQPDLFLTSSQATKGEGKPNWTNVRVIGELKQSENPKEFKKELIRFSGLAREVFASQPTRRYLHGFFIRGSIVEPWVFDRSGPYGGEKFDIHKDPNRFIRVMAGYTLMSDEELGLNTYIEAGKDGKYIMFRGEDERKEEKLYLEKEPIAFQRAIVCRGTTCYRAKRQNSKRWEFVVKFSWRSDKRRAEGELLKLAKEREVWGVAHLFGHKDLESIADLREGMDFGEPRTYRSATETSFSESQSGTSGLLSGLEISQQPRWSSSRQRRKRHGETSSIQPIQTKRLRSENSQRRLDVTSLVKKQDDSPGEVNRHSVEQPNATSLVDLTSPNSEAFENRILSCLVIFPPGRPIREFESVKDFLTACCDIVRALRSLYLDGKVLHRDISENNLIITDAETEGEPRGVVIDLDLGKELDCGPSGARHRTGTMEFMAIEVLEGTAHTYRHDLESFFYVFLWVIIRYGHEGTTSLPRTSRLRDWYQGTYSQIAAMKGGQMDRKRFRRIVEEFPSKFHCVKELAEELRRALFPIHEESLFTGTYRDPELLYIPMIGAFERAIDRCVEDHPNNEN